MPGVQNAFHGPRAHLSLCPSCEGSSQDDCIRAARPGGELRSIYACMHLVRAPGSPSDLLAILSERFYVLLITHTATVTLSACETFSLRRITHSIWFEACFWLLHKGKGVSESSGPTEVPFDHDLPLLLGTSSLPDHGCNFGRICPLAVPVRISPWKSKSRLVLGTGSAVLIFQ
jgi:hypothetical protein